MAEWLRRVPAKHFYAGSSPVGSSINERRLMPVRKVGANKWRYGQTGKVYSSKKKAIKQGIAIRASQRRAGKKVK